MANAWLSAGAMQSHAVAALLVEQHGSPVEQATREEGFTAQVQLRCPWEHRYTVMSDIVGNGLFYPRATGSLAFAQSASCQNADTQSSDDSSLPKTIKYVDALITINYGMPKSNNSGTGQTAGGQLFSESLEPTAEFLTIEPTDLHWGSSIGTAVKPEEAPGKLILGFDYVQTRYNQVYGGGNPMPSKFLTAISQCNSGELHTQLLNMAFGVETALYHGAQLSRSLNSDGQGSWTVANRFSIRPTGWNKFWRASTNSWQEIKHTDGTVIKPIPPTDLSGLLV